MRHTYIIAYAGSGAISLGDAQALIKLARENHASLVLVSDAESPSHASEIEAGMELHLPCLVKLGQGNSGYKIIEEFLPEAGA